MTTIAAAALGNILFFFVWLFGFGPVCAIAPMIAHILGAHPDNRADVRAVVRMGLWAVIIMAPAQMAFLFAAKPMLLFLHQDPVLASGAGTFLAPLAIGLPFSLGYQAMRNFATALRRPRACCG